MAQRDQLQEQYLETINSEQLDAQLVQLLPFEFLKQQCAIPLALPDGTVAVALCDPDNLEAYDAISTTLNRQCVKVICPADEIEKAISRCYYGCEDIEQHDQGGGKANSVAAGHEIEGLTGTSATEDLLSIANKAPVIKLVNNFFFQAVQSRASDIHIEPYEDQVRVRFRIDGVLHDISVLPTERFPALLSRLKVMANLNIAERRLPQDGQSRIKIGEDMVDVRVSVIPTSCGERVVLRLLNKSGKNLRLDEIGFSPAQVQQFRRLIGLSHGIILLTGPTGSGKTTTLYAALNKLNCEERNILTVEDPVEYRIAGIGQMQTKPKIGLTFANCLRHILRQDPDVIMIGEIRDAETAEIAVQASLTGHLVLSTLHTNDAASAITRLIDIGIEPYLISSSVVAVMAQRLVRTICPHCKTAYKPQGDIAAACDRTVAGAAVVEHLYKGQGCDKCIQTGYLGRTGIFELMIVCDAIRELASKRCSSHIIKKTAVEEGMSTLRDDGIRKALAGVTTLQEVLRVTQDTAQSDTEVADNAHIEA